MPPPRPERSELIHCISEFRTLNNHMEQHVEYIGYLAGLLSLITWLPQLQTVWIRRDHQTLDPRGAWPLSLSLISWGVYGTITHNWWLLIGCIIGLTMTLSMIYRIRTLRKQHADRNDPLSAHAGYKLTHVERRRGWSQPDW